MRQLNITQKRSLSNFFNRLSAVWFSSAIIVPLNSRPNSLLEIVLPFTLGIIMTYLFLRTALQLVREDK